MKKALIPIFIIGILSLVCCFLECYLFAIGTGLIDLFAGLIYVLIHKDKPLMVQKLEKLEKEYLATLSEREAKREQIKELKVKNSKVNLNKKKKERKW